MSGAAGSWTRSWGRSDAMTEAEWVASTDPEKMLEYLRGKASERKLRLFACAFGRAVRESQHLLGPSTVAVAERYADGLASDQELASERRRWACSPEERGPVAPSAYDGAWEAVDSLTRYERVWRHDPDSYSCIPADAVLKGSALLLRDIFGNPFRPSPHLPAAIIAWNDGTIRHLAEGIYEERQMPERTLDTARLAVLADALEEAGCDNAEILGHLRGPGPHVRGCHVVDHLLGKDAALHGSHGPGRSKEGGRRRSPAASRRLRPRG